MCMTKVHSFGIKGQEKVADVKVRREKSQFEKGSMCISSLEERPRVGVRGERDALL